MARVLNEKMSLQEMIQEDATKFSPEDVKLMVIRTIQYIGSNYAYFPPTGTRFGFATFNNRLTSAAGKTWRKRYPKGGMYYFQVDIATKYMKVAKSEDIIATILHEAIHCIHGCFDHGGRFKLIAELLTNDLGLKTKITVYNWSSEWIAESLKYRETKGYWEVSCSVCGAKYKPVKKMCPRLEKIQKHPKQVGCTSCGTWGSIVANYVKKGGD